MKKFLCCFALIVILAVLASFSFAGGLEGTIIICSNAGIRTDSSIVGDISDGSELSSFEGGLGVSPNSNKWKNKPVPEKSVPKAKDGLLNPKEPIHVITEDEKLSFFFKIYEEEYADKSDVSIRLINSKGRTLGTASKSNTNITIDMPEDKEDYYLEIHDVVTMTQGGITLSPLPFVKIPIGKTKPSTFEGYCYIHVRVTNARKYDPFLNMSQSEQDKMMRNSQILYDVEAKYMKEHNIKSERKLTRKDKEAIAKEANSIIGEEYFSMPK